jgi:FKBP-type peptidyl-prolyl cis-trans isomerase
MKVTIYDAINQAQPDLEVQIDEINDSLKSLAIENSALFEALHSQPSGSTNTQALQEKERALEEDRLALEAEKKAMEQSQRVCTVSKELIGSKEGHEFINNSTADEASAQFGDSVAVNYTGDMGGGKHIYEGNKASQKAKVLYGNSYGGKSVFD